MKTKPKFKKGDNIVAVDLDKVFSSYDVEEIELENNHYNLIYTNKEGNKYHLNLSISFVDKSYKKSLKQILKKL